MNFKELMELETTTPEETAALMQILAHGTCGELLRMGTNRVLFCPKCVSPQSRLMSGMVLCCVECEKPLEVVSGGGSYCIRCKFSPSLQDTYLQKLEER